MFAFYCCIYDKELRPGRAKVQPMESREFHREPTGMETPQALKSDLSCNPDCTNFSLWDCGQLELTQIPFPQMQDGGDNMRM